MWEMVVRRVWDVVVRVGVGRGCEGGCGRWL